MVNQCLEFGPPHVPSSVPVPTLTRVGLRVGNVAAATGVCFGWALLAGASPGRADGGATQRLGAHHPSQLAPTHVVGHLGEAGASPEI